MVEDGDARRDPCAALAAEDDPRSARPRGRHPALSLDPLDVRAEPAQALVDPLVAAVDLADVPDRGRALRAQAREEHGHPGPDVGARQPLAVELRRAGDDDAV